MFSIDSKIYLQLPHHDDPGTLHPGKVVSVNDRKVNAVLDVRLGDHDSAIDGIVHYYDGADFVRQAAKVQLLFSGRSGSGVLLTLLGQSINADKRKNPRLPVDSSKSPVQLNNIADGCLVDVSVAGCAVASYQEHQVGDVLDVVLDCNGLVFKGKAEVQQRTTQQDGTFRYGLRCLDGTDSEDRLAEESRFNAIEAMNQKLQDQTDQSPFSLPTPRPRR